MVDSANMLSAPVIGISGSSADSASVRAMMTQITGSGAIPLFLGNHLNRNADADLSKIDALVVMGNNADIDPSKYGASKDPHTICETDDAAGKARAQYEEKLMQKALDTKMPILGVCGGMQRLNVMCGGTLYQHVPDLIDSNYHTQLDYNIAPFIPVQAVTIQPDTKLASIAAEINTIYTPGHTPIPPDVIMENSMHHQAVAQIGNNLRVAATTKDVNAKGTQVDIVEGIEADPNGKYGNQFLVAVQWHPEFSASPLGAKLAQNVTEAAKAFKQEHGTQHSMDEVQKENQLSALPNVKLTTVEDAKVLPGSFVAKFLEQRRNMSGPAVG